MKRLFRLLLVLSNVLAVCVFWACCLSTYFQPQCHPRVAVLGLGFPIALFAVLCFVPIWLVVWRRMVLLSLLAVLSCLFFVLDYCPINFSRDVPDGALKIITWNSHGYGYGPDAELSRKLSGSYLLQSEADIICVQEAGSFPDSVLAEMKALGYEHRHDKSLDIFTKYPILQTDTVRYFSSSNSSRYYYLLVDGDTVLLVNNHLESYRLTNEEKQDYKDMVRKPGKERVKTEGRFLLSRLAEGTKVRGAQVDSLMAVVERNSSHPIILCGDFNDTPVSYTYQQLSRSLTSAFRQSGCGVGLSYNQKGFYVRIDHLFFSAPWCSYGTYMDTSISTSDHYPLVSWLKRSEK